jgi:TolB-like protein
MGASLEEIRLRSAPGGWNLHGLDISPAEYSVAGNPIPGDTSARKPLPYPSQDYFADGMTDELITELGQISELRVISRTSVMTYKGTRKSLPQIARELNVDAVVEGTVLRSGDQVRVTAQLILAPADKHLWAQSYEGDVSRTFALQRQVARAIAEEIKIELTSHERDVLKRVGRESGRL